MSYFCWINSWLVFHLSDTFVLAESPQKSCPSVHERFQRKPSNEVKEWTGKMIYFNFNSIFGDFVLKFFEEEVSDYLCSPDSYVLYVWLIITPKISTRGTVCREAPKL